MLALSVHDIDPWSLKLLVTCLVPSFALQTVWSLTFTLRIVTTQQKSTALPGQNYVSLLGFYLWNTGLETGLVTLTCKGLKLESEPLYMLTLQT